ncbi:MAG: tetratricopeptide repeat protein [Candidatus Krumholzibacteria bacterium]
MLRTFIYAGLILITAAGFAGAFGMGSTALAAAGSDAALPTVGGEPAFATRADAMVSTVEGFLQVKDYVAAEKAALELTERNPEFLTGWMMLGYCRSRVSKFEESNQAYHKALALGADKRSIQTREAYNHIRLGKYDEAKALYREMLDANETDSVALKQLGYLDGKLENYDDAAYYYRKLLDNDPENSEVIASLAKIEAKRGGGNEVRILLEKTLELDPDNTDALGKLGLMLIREKEFTAAADRLLKLVTIEPANAKARRNLGVAYYQLGKKSKARSEFERVSELGGSMKGLYGPLADCCVRSGLNTRALEVIKQGLQANEQKAWLYSMWGKMLEKSKRYDAAIAKFSKAVELKEAPWSGYARKQIARQVKLKHRAEMISQQGMQ